MGGPTMAAIDTFALGAHASTVRAIPSSKKPPLIPACRGAAVPQICCSSGELANMTAGHNHSLSSQTRLDSEEFEQGPSFEVEWQQFVTDSCESSPSAEAPTSGQHFAPTRNRLMFHLISVADQRGR